MKIKEIILGRAWIPAIGYALAIGFINNLLIAPFVDIQQVDWAQLATALGILLSISGARDYLTKNSLDAIPENISSKGWKRYWIPIIGWVLFFGYFLNCAIAPYFKLQINDWVQLSTTLTVMLGISGFREVVLLPKRTRRKKTKKTSKKQPTGEQ